jgi:hypothetical protein
VTPRECPREGEVTAAIRDRAWRGEDEDVRRHARECPACAEVLAVCEALHRTLGPVDKHLPSAGQVWHRATLRARADAVQSASRPLVWSYGVAGAAVAGLALAVAGRWWPALVAEVRRLEWTSPAPAGVPTDVGGWVLAMLQGGLPLVVAACVCLALAPLAVYLAIRDDQKL